MVEEVKVTCKICGSSVEASQFVLDHHYKMMACPMCIRDRKSKQKKNVEKQTEEQLVVADANNEENIEVLRSDASLGEIGVTNSPTTNEEDVDIEKEYRKKLIEREKEKEKAVRAVRLDDEKVKYKCPKCKYEFVYNTVKQAPARCPYCSDDVKEFVC
ncbi:hypothetical protein HN695_04840 [Candidatus Woesearchaeota archaeon]|jgi:DNA-directed RNA polymerase subunit RPC12/RpoP|nr:hypothetical protein [Candidatus Woesearchaeota archaeon]MBT5272050.1 hypothetical protein [Candidatus Woesearchaeota archaeon]MBT6041800.1 hypothetical protein [Candidatus Woesearchaeota archaeon]MBT6336825.1 hypothetical protein [Candidatus Woesearchaeota archaeon]MBT7927640.1 hypothetical protein [Candidatus Woesearchaeota archaeon]